MHAAGSSAHMTQGLGKSSPSPYVEGCTTRQCSADNCRGLALVHTTAYLLAMEQQYPLHILRALFWVRCCGWRCLHHSSSWLVLHRHAWLHDTLSAWDGVHIASGIACTGAAEQHKHCMENVKPFVLSLLCPTQHMPCRQSFQGQLGFQTHP